jgi:hypothetical protein
MRERLCLPQLPWRLALSVLIDSANKIQGKQSNELNLMAIRVRVHS